MSHHLRILLIAAFIAPASAAETFVVTKEQDDNGPCTSDDCALREAVLAANALPGPDVIEIPGGIYELSLVGPVEEDYSQTGDLDILEGLEVRGDVMNPVTIVGDGTDRVIEVGTFDAVQISHISITGGNSISSGGGLRVGGADFILEDSTISGNITRFADGGGLFFGALRNATIRNCTFVDNHAPIGQGGGIRATVAGASRFVNVINVTVSGNSARSGGGIYLFSTANYDLVNLTVADNEAATVFGDGLVGDGTNRLTVSNSLFSNNNCGFISGIARSNGHNMEGPTATCFDPYYGDQMGVPDIGLGPLADNGGPTLTHALLRGSPAVDAALDADCPPTDQRGVARPVDGDLDGVARCDIGAFEVGFQGVTAVPTLTWPGLLALLALLSGAGLVLVRRGVRHSGQRADLRGSRVSGSTESFPTSTSSRAS